MAADERADGGEPRTAPRHASRGAGPAEGAGMTHGLLPEVVEVAEDADTGTGRAGLPLGLETLRALVILST